MTVADPIDIADVIGRVRLWPASMRLTLARRILETLECLPEGKAALEPPRGPTASEIAAKFKTERPAPDDATAQKWIAEHRKEKYGQ